MKKKSDFKFIHLIFVLSLLLLIYFSIKSVYIRNQVRGSSNQIIAKFTSKDILPKTTNFYFTYFFNGKKYITAKSGIKFSVFNTETETNAIRKLEINEFYLANFDVNYPNVINVNPLKKITDTTVILKAGFSKEDIKIKKSSPTK